MAKKKRTTPATKPTADPPLYRRPRLPRGADLSYIAADLRGLAMPVADLVPDPENARRHNDGNLTAIVASFRKYGQRKPIVVNARTREVEAGNGTLQGLQHLGRDYVAAVLVEDDNTTARGFSIADNRSAELAEWDLDILLPQIDLLEEADEDLVTELLLDELRATEDEPDALVAVSSSSEPQCFQVVVECDSEADQQKLFQRMKKQGYRARVISRAEFVSK